jgi:ADP-ribose pyrophosphatase YjhB (NUDIX family)
MADEVQGEFPVGASVVLWRADEILVMKRSGGTGAGGWFFPGGHLEGGERPAEACVREVREETEIELPVEALELVDVMTHLSDWGRHSHVIIYNAACPAGAEPVLDHEHLAARWMAPEAYLARFMDEAMFRERRLPESAVELAREVARVTRSATAAWRAKERR